MGTPIDRVAKEFGITGRGLAKICERLDIPTPPRGYWAKLAAVATAGRTLSYTTLGDTTYCGHGKHLAL
ncbi:MAG TPA: hypothetical protein VKZ79_08190 [Alphaproteobacteria bacterium]|nr:hypothetical protein [Alphaproteobacteria bacterium]